MAKITVNGDHVTITSDITLEEYNKIRRYEPEALKLKDEDGNEVFRVDFNPECHHSVSENGIIFHSIDSNRNLFMTTMNEVVGLHDNLEEERRLITDRYASILVKLGTVEANLLQMSAHINGIAEAVQDSIHICGEQEVTND